MSSSSSLAVSVRIEVATAMGVSGQRSHDLRLSAQPAYVTTARRSSTG